MGDLTSLYVSEKYASVQCRVYGPTTREAANFAKTMKSKDAKIKTIMVKRAS